MKRISQTVGLGLSVALLGAPAAHASWLSKITGVHIDPSAGTMSIEAPHPEAIPDMLRNLPQDVAQAVLNPAGSALAQAIRTSHAQCISGSRHIPPEIRAQLAPFFPPKILDKALYNTDKTSVSLPGLIRTINENYAVTLDDLIVFPDAQAASNPELWAHELTHVTQYDNMGVESFANIYSLTGGSGLEAEARAWQAKVRSALQDGSAQMASAGAFVNDQVGDQRSQILAQQWQQAAQQAIPPQQCAQWQPIPNGAFIRNVCPAPVLIQFFTVQTQVGPQFVGCTFNCIVPPGGGGPFLGSGPYMVVGLNFAY